MFTNNDWLNAFFLFQKAFSTFKWSTFVGQTYSNSYLIILSEIESTKQNKLSSGTEVLRRQVNPVETPFNFIAYSFRFQLTIMFIIVLRFFDNTKPLEPTSKDIYETLLFTLYILLCILSSMTNLILFVYSFVQWPEVSKNTSSFSPTILGFIWISTVSKGNVLDWERWDISWLVRKVYPVWVGP